MYPAGAGELQGCTFCPNGVASWMTTFVHVQLVMQRVFGASGAVT